MGHKHNVFDTDTHFSIDPITKRIKNESSKKTTLIQGDHNSERFSFSMPRYIEGHDMTRCDLVEVHYDNKETGTANVSSDYYEVKDLKVSPEDEAVVVFSWLIIDTATKYIGSLEFGIKFKCTSEGAADYEWNTGINKDISVSEGKNNSGVVVERAPNVVDQWRKEIFGNAENAVANINLAEKEAISDVKAEGTLQVENVKAAGESIVSEREQIYLNNTLKASVIEGNAEGTTIILDDSAKQPFVEMSVLGKSEQATTKGYQLIDVTLGGETTVSGLKIAPTEDGDLIVNGKHIEGAMWLEFGKTSLVAGKTYTLSCSEGFSLHLWDLTNGKEFRTKKLDVESIKIEANENIECAVVLNDAVLNRTYSNYKVCAILNEGDSILPWEKYTGGIPSPNPEYPQEINSVENPEVIVCGKNLLDIAQALNENLTESNGIYTLTRNEGGERFSGEVPLNIPANVPFKVSLKMIDSTNSSNRLPLYFRGVSGKTYYASLSTEYSCLYEEKIVSIGMYLATSEEVGAYVSFCDMQIEIGKTTTDFETCKAEQSIVLPYTLHGISVTSGGNYTDADGQQWICDEVDLERGVLVQRTVSEMMGNYDWWTGNPTNDGSGKTYYVFNSKFNGKGGLATHFKTRTTAIQWENLPVGQCFLTPEYLVVSTTHSTKEELKTWMAENEAKILFALNEPIEIPLSEAEIEAFKSLKTNYPTTTILNDSGANMAVRYGIDTKTYIDKKIEELKSLMTT